MTSQSLIIHKLKKLNIRVVELQKLDIARVHLLLMRIVLIFFNWFVKFLSPVIIRLYRSASL